MGAPLVGLDLTYTFKKETTFGTAVTNSGTQIPTEELSIDHQIQAHSLQRATGIRGLIQDDQWTDQVGSTPTAAASFYLSEGMMPIIPAVLQYSGVYAAASNVTTYTTYNYAELPDFSASQGYFYTLMQNSPDGAGQKDAYITSAIGTSMTLSIAPDANEGALYCAMEFAGKSSTTGATISPVIDSPTVDVLYKWSDITHAVIGAYDILTDFVSAEWTVANNAKAVPSAPAQDFALLRWEVTGNFTMLDDSANAEALKALAKLSTPAAGIPLVVQWGGPTGGALVNSGDCMISGLVCLTGYDVDRSEEAKVTFNWVGAFSSDAASKPFNIAYYA